jgi:ABC-2 type transport system permease protein
MIQQLHTIARNTFIESIRQPIFVVLLLTGSLALVMNPSLAAFTLENDDKLLVDLGLSTLFLAGLLMAAFSATGAMSAEIESKTVLTVVSKPISRPLFVVGKFVGVASAIGVAYWVLSLIFLLTVRHRVMQTTAIGFDGPVIVFGLLAFLGALLLAAFGNYLYQWVFTSSFVFSVTATMTAAYLLVLVVGKQWQLQSILYEFQQNNGHLGQLMLGLIMVFEAVLILTAVALATSTRLGQIMTLAICAGVFVLGLISDYAFSKLAAQFSPAIVLYWIAPNLQLLWPADALTQENTFSAGYIAAVSGYTVFYVTAVLSVAVMLFQSRDVG